MCLEGVLVETSVYMWNGWFWCAVMLWMITYVCLERLLVESSVYVGNGFCKTLKGKNRLGHPVGVGEAHLHFRTHVHIMVHTLTLTYMHVLT